MKTNDIKIIGFILGILSLFACFFLAVLFESLIFHYLNYKINFIQYILIHIGVISFSGLIVIFLFQNIFISLSKELSK